MRPLRIPRALRRIKGEGLVNDGRCVRVRSAVLVSAAGGVRGTTWPCHAAITAVGAREGALPNPSPGSGPGNFAEVLSEIGTSAWRKRHAHVHVDLHSRRLRNMEPPSVLD